jgi:hypothetical protein
VFLGPWGWLKLSAFNIGSTEWVLYTAGFLVLNLFFLPAAFISCVWIAKRMAHSSQSITRLVASQSQALLPLGLMAWIAFTISFALPKLTYILGVLNDPFGWGWHLLGVFRPSTTLDVSGFSPILQVLILIIGLFWGARVALKQSRALGSYKIRNNLPLLVFCLTFSMVMVWLLVG